MADSMAEEKAMAKNGQMDLLVGRFVLTMMVAGVTYLAGAFFTVAGFTHLGYPMC